jgi:3-deoxy-D-manno-octulosonate 8-phosphate phosphatase (KDO 8-P phosphatase)
MKAKKRAAKIKMILMDVDGTLTDGSLLILPDGEELKSFNVRDGMGALLAQLAGLRMAIITGKSSKSLEKRAERLKITEVYQGVIDKKPILDGILEKHGLKPDQVAYIGDDLGDFELIKSVGLAAAVADAHPIIKKNCHYICDLPGGKGAVREFIEFIIESQGKWEMIQNRVKDIFNRKS